MLICLKVKRELTSSWVLFAHAPSAEFKQSDVEMQHSAALNHGNWSKTFAQCKEMVEHYIYDTSTDW